MGYIYNPWWDKEDPVNTKRNFIGYIDRLVENKAEYMQGEFHLSVFELEDDELKNLMTLFMTYIEEEFDEDFAKDALRYEGIVNGIINERCFEYQVSMETEGAYIGYMEELINDYGSSGASLKLAQ